MSDYLPKWHRELDIFNKIKPIIILEGNVLDSYQYPLEGSVALNLCNICIGFKLISKNVLNWIIGFEDGFAFAQDSLFASPFEVNFSHNVTSNVNLCFPPN